VTPVDGRKDLVVLVADKDMQATIQQLLDRPASLGIRKISTMFPCRSTMIVVSSNSATIIYGPSAIDTSMRFPFAIARGVVVNTVDLGKTWNEQWRKGLRRTDGMIAPGLSWSIRNWRVGFGLIPESLRRSSVGRDTRKICGVGSDQMTSCEPANPSRRARRSLVEGASPM
jgi:hypothetical protein